MAYVKSTVLLGLGESNEKVRHTAGTTIMAILYNEETGAWPEALDALTKGMASQDSNMVDVSGVVEIWSDMAGCLQHVPEALRGLPPPSRHDSLGCEPP